jgi:hypothetical protein
MSSPPRGFHIQDRDTALLLGLFESRVMTLAHVATLFFDGRKEMAKKRVQKLKAAGLIGERPRRAYDPSILTLTSKAYALLAESGVLDAFPALSRAAMQKRAAVSPITLAHELEVMNVKAAFHSAIAKTEKFSLVEFGTWPVLYQFTAGGTRVKPDGFIRIQEKEDDGGISEHTFFLEVDRSTEKLDILVRKAVAYREYYQSGDFAVRNGQPRSAFKEFPFRVLVVCKTEQRRENLSERLLALNPPIRTIVCVTTMAAVLINALTAVCATPTVPLLPRL